MANIDSQKFLSGQTPSEIWTLIFAFVLGCGPFGPDERSAYSCLRGVCATWRRILAENPGLCPGLSIDWGHLAANFDMEAFKAKYTPWLSILRQNQPYHLTLGMSWDALEDENATSLLEYLLCEATPTPTILHIQSQKIFEGMLSMTGTCDTILHLNLDHPYKDLDEYDHAQLQVVAPQLESFTTNARLTFEDPFTCPSLQSLTILAVLGDPEDVAQLCTRMPRLRTLKLAYDDNIDELSSNTAMGAPFNHSALEMIVLQGQYLFPLMGHLTLPSLKFLDLQLWEASGMDEDTQIWKENVPACLQRSGLSNLTVALRGRCSESFFATFTRSLPQATRLVVRALAIGPEEGTADEEHSASTEIFDLSKVKEMACYDRSFLCDYTSRLVSCDREIPVMVPKGILEEGEMEPLMKVMREKGFVLKEGLEVAEDVLDFLDSSISEESMS